MMNLTVKELKRMAKEAGIKGYYNMRKAELVAALESNNAVEEIIDVFEEVMNPFNNERANEPTFEEKPKADGGIALAGTTNNNKNNTNNKGENTMNNNTNTNTTNTKGANNMNTNNTKSNNKINNKGENKMKKTDKELQFIADRDAYGILAIMNARHNNNKVQKIQKQESKNLEVVASRQVVASAVIVGKDNEGNAVYDLALDTEVNVGLESNLTRAAKSEVMKFADKGMVLLMKGTNEVISINLDNSLYQDIAQLEPVRAKLFNILTGHGDHTLALRISKNGLATIYTSKKAVQEAQLKDTQILITYKFLGLTPSGLRSKALMGASVQIKTKNAEVGCDRRVYLLDKSTDGCLTMNFMENDGKSFTKLKSKADQFKNSSRLTLGAPGSKEMREVDTYVVFNNIAEGAEFTNVEGKVVSAKNICDGNVLVDAEIPATSSIIPLRTSDYVGVTDQVRGAGLKVSVTYTDKMDLVTVFRQLNSNNSAAEIAYIVVDGVRYTSWEEVVAAGADKVFFKRIQMIADLNGMKMKNHNNIFKLTRLKMAYQSAMNMSMVTAMACLLADPVKAQEMLVDKGLKGIAKKFEGLNVKYEVKDGNIVNYGTDFTTKGLNNETQTMSYIGKLDPIKTLQVFPDVKRNEFFNVLKGITTALTKSEIELDESYYTVVQADKSVLFGKQLLAEDEIFVYNATVEKLSASRHPISSLHAVTTFKTVSPIEMIERILALDVNDYVKRFLLNNIVGAKNVCIIPASHFLMEKHDGMDFDIDTLQLIYDQDVVECLEKLPNRGSEIRDSEAATAARHVETQEEVAITNWKKNRNLGLVRPDVVDSNVETEETNENKELNSGSSRIAVKYDEVKNTTAAERLQDFIDLSFDQILDMAAQYFETKIASVGEIANAFYNNALILLTLKSDAVDQQTKDAIVLAFKKYYGCNGTEQYVSKIDRTAKKFEVDKLDCTNAVFRFAESDGSIHSLIAYLEDCCDYNRFLAETSIDSAKNNFFIINMYKHSNIVSSLGAKADCTFELVRADKAFGDIAHKNNIDTVNNYFGLELISPKMNKEEALSPAKYIAQDGKITVETDYGVRTKDAVLAIKDPLYAVKLELAKVTNNLIVIASKLLQDIVVDPKAAELRARIIQEAHEVKVANKVLGNKKTGKIAALNAITQSYATLTLSLKEAHNNDTSDSREIEGISKVEYVKTVVAAGIRNAALENFSGLTPADFGALICGELAKNVSETSCGAINAGFYKVCEKEIVAYLAQLGFDKVGLVGEELTYAQLNNKIVKLSNYVGTNVSIVDGIAELEDGTRFVAKNRRANLVGTITEVDNKFYVQSIRQSVEADPEAGLFINVNSELDKFCDNVDNVEILSYEYHTTYTNSKGVKLYSVVVGKDAQDNEYVVACLHTRDKFKDLLSKMDLSNISTFSTKTRNGNILRVLYVPGADYQAALNNTVEESSDFDFFTAVPTGLEMPEMVAENKEEDAFDFSQFAAPIFA